MTNNRMRGRVFRLEFSHMRPSELSILYLQSEVIDSTAFLGKSGSKIEIREWKVSRLTNSNRKCCYYE